jgi:integral membrane protein
MQQLLQTTLGRLRITGFAEAISWLILLLVAMPLKYIWHNPLPVKYVGWVHGLLFIAYVVQLLNVSAAKRWPFSKTALGFLAAFLPFGTLVFDRQLKDR